VPHLPTSEPTTDPVDGATLVAEAATAEAALAEVHDQLGPDARILDARRVHRGGIGGFFAKETVQLHAAPGLPTTPSSPPAASMPSSPPASSSLSMPIDRLLVDVEEAPDTVDFATFLKAQLRGPTSTPQPASEPTPQPPPTPISEPRGADRAEAADADRLAVRHEHELVGERAVAAAGPRPTEEEGPRWSVGTLIRMGLPPELVRAIVVEEPVDDVTWTAGLAAALRPLCRPLPSGRSMLLGPRARVLASARNLPVVSVDRPVGQRNEVAAVLRAGHRSADWLDRVRRGRWLHLVVGGAGWRPLLHEDPLAVSWATPADLPDAVRTASELGLVLGYGPLGGAVRRARPLDVALALRDQVPGR
jgi:hypothetical protein